MSCYLSKICFESLLMRQNFVLIGTLCHQHFSLGSPHADCASSACQIKSNESHAKKLPNVRIELTAFRLLFDNLDYETNALPTELTGLFQVLG